MKNFDLEPFDEETKILLSFVNNNFLIDKVEKVEFMSDIIGHEITAYNAKKLYVVKRIVITDNADVLVLPYCAFYDENNLIKFYITNSLTYWDSGANQIHFITNYFTLKNILFSKIATLNYNSFEMIGYRITLK